MGQIGVGIDIGHGAIKIVQLAKQHGRLELTGYSKVLLPAGLINNGLITDEALLVGALKTAISRLRIKQKKVIAAVAGDAVLIRNFTLPVMLGPELNSLIRSEVEKFIPFPITEAEFDWDIIHQYQERGEMELMVVAAQNQLIASQVNCLKKAGLQPVIVDAQPFADLRALGIETGNPSILEEVAVLNIGSAITQMDIFYHGGLRVNRTITIAGEALTRAVAEKLEISPEKAEAVKCNLGDADYIFMDELSGTENYRANQVLRQKLAELIIEIQRSLEYFKLQFNGATVSQLVITGGGGKLRNLPTYLGRELGLTVKLGDPLAGIHLHLKQGDHAVLLGNPNQFGVAIGLALRGVE
ncbi:MAG: type IV pilus assembly protein PilM [Bacillota bacterium]